MLRNAAGGNFEFLNFGTPGIANIFFSLFRFLFLDPKQQILVLGFCSVLFSSRNQSRSWRWTYDPFAHVFWWSVGWRVVEGGHFQRQLIRKGGNSAFLQLTMKAWKARLYIIVPGITGFALNAHRGTAECKESLISSGCIFLLFGWAAAGPCTACIISRTHAVKCMVQSQRYLSLCRSTYCFPPCGGRVEGRKNLTAAKCGPTWVGSCEENVSLVLLVRATLCVVLTLATISGLESAWVRPDFGS